MAEIVGVVASAVTLAATAHGAAQLSKVVFKVVATYKGARKEMADIAQELSGFSGSLQNLADVLNHCQTLCKPEFFNSTKDIILKYRRLEADLQELIIDTKTGKLLKPRWCMRKPKVKKLLGQIQSIKGALLLELSILNLARDQVMHSPATRDAEDQGVSISNRWRSVVESVVQANRQVVESAQEEDIEDPVQKHSHLEGIRTGLDIWKENSFDSATWLYHLVFGPSVQGPPYQASVSDENPERHEGMVTLRPELDQSSQNTASSQNRELIVWNARTEPGYVVDKLLSTWTTLSSTQIHSSSVHQKDRKDWGENALGLLDEAKREVEKEEESELEESDVSIEGSAFSGDWDHRPTEVNKRAQRNVRFDSKPSWPNVTIYGTQTREDARKAVPAKPVPTSRTTGSNEDHRGRPESSRRNIPPTEHLHGASRWRGGQRSMPGDGRYTHPLYNQSNEYGSPLHRREERNPSLFPNPASSNGYGQRNSFANPYLGTRPATYPQHAPPPPQPPPVPTSEDLRLSKIEDLLAAQQDSLARFLHEHSGAHDSAQTKSLSAVMSEYNKIIRDLTRSFKQEKETRHRTEEDTVAERNRLVIIAEERLAMIQKLERMIVQQKDEQRKAEEEWQCEKQAFQQQIATTAEMKEAALKDVIKARAVTDELQQRIEVLKAEAEAERKFRTEDAIKAADARRKADADSAERFQRYQKLLRESAEAPKRNPADGLHRVQPTLKMKGNSIEISGYTAETLGCPMNSLLSPQRVAHDYTQRLEIDTSYTHPSWTRGERPSSFVASLRSLQSASPSIANFSNKTGRQDQQMILFPFRPNANIARLSGLQQSLEKAGVGSILQEQQDGNSGQVVLYNGSNNELVQSTVIWDPPILDLGSELLLTYKQVGWKPVYCRKSAGGRTYFYGDQPVHSYFFHDSYVPHFVPPSSPTETDAVIISRDLIEESVLSDLQWYFCLTETGEYVLDAGLTYGDIERLIARSFLKREDDFRRKHPRQLGSRQSTSPASRTTFEPAYASSIVSSTSRSLRGSSGSTELGHSEDDGFETSQTSQADLDDDHSISNEDCIARKSPSVTQRSGKSTNPFHMRIQDGRTISSNNPWAERSFWDSDSWSGQ